MLPPPFSSSLPPSLPPSQWHLPGLLDLPCSFVRSSLQERKRLRERARARASARARERERERESQRYREGERDLKRCVSDVSSAQACACAHRRYLANSSVLCRRRRRRQLPVASSKDRQQTIPGVEINHHDCYHCNHNLCNLYHRRAAEEAANNE